MHISTGVLKYFHNILLNTFAISRFILNDFCLFVLFVVIIYRTKRCVLLYWRFFTMFVSLFLVPCVPSFHRLFSSKKWSWENRIFVQNNGNQPPFDRFQKQLLDYLFTPNVILHVLSSCFVCGIYSSSRPEKERGNSSCGCVRFYNY